MMLPVVAARLPVSVSCIRTLQQVTLQGAAHERPRFQRRVRLVAGARGVLPRPQFAALAMPAFPLVAARGTATALARLMLGATRTRVAATRREAGTAATDDFISDRPDAAPCAAVQLAESTG